MNILEMLEPNRISDVRMDVTTLKELQRLVSRRLDRIDDKVYGKKSGIRANPDGKHGYMNIYCLLNDLIKENS